MCLIRCRQVLERFSSLRWRLSLSYAVMAVVVTALLTGLAVHTAATISITAQKESALSAIAGVSAGFSDALSTTSDPALIARQQGLAAGGRVLWLGPDGRVQVDGWGNGSLSGRFLPLPPSLTNSAVQQVVICNTGDNWVAYAAAPLLINQHQAGRLLLVRDLSPLRQEIGQLQRRLWLLGGIFTCLLAVVGLFMANSLARPLEFLTGATRRMQAGDLHQSVPATGSREMVSLAVAFNDMAVRVSKLDEQRRAFVADAAHELRTPLASLQVLAEGMELDAFVRQTERLGRLVDELLMLARLDNPELSIVWLPLRVSDVIQEAWWVIKPLAAARQVQLHTEEVNQQLWLQGDPDWLHQAFVNILNNAVRYAPRGGWVRLAVQCREGWLDIIIEDSGVGVPDEVLAQLGTRFYRPSSARERSTGGTGLGLAIVREIMRLHQGRLVFTSPPGQGLIVTMILPAGPADLPGEL